MKKTQLIYALLLMIIFFSCKKDHVKEEEEEVTIGAPSITKITSTDNKDIVKEEMDKVIIMHGDNLVKVKAVSFNKLPADSYSEKSNKTIEVRIPGKLPLEVNNQVKVVTEKGEATFTFEVIIPKLAITDIKKEFDAAKNVYVVTITGQHFDLYNIAVGKVNAGLNSNPITLQEATSNSLVLEVPNSAVQKNSIMTLDNEYVRAIYTKPFEIEIPFEMNSGTEVAVFAPINFATRTSGNKDAVMSDGTATGDPAPFLAGQKFLRIKDKTTSGGNWISLSWTFMEPIPEEPKYADLLANPSGYYLKFEILTNNPIKAAQIRFAIGSALTWTEKEYLWQPATGDVPFNTDKKWQTVTIDCASFGGLPPLNPGTIIDAGQPVGANFLVLDLIPNEAYTENIDFCYTNFRFVKK